MGDVSTRPVTRNKLAQFLGNLELIRLVENLTSDVGKILPDALQELVESAQDNASAANVARELAVLALALASQAGDGPPPAPMVLPDIPDDMTARVCAMEARLAAAERLISELREGPAP